MAPSRIEPQSAELVATSTWSNDTPAKPSMYLLEHFPQESIEYCRQFFDTVLHTDKGVHHWRECADAILVREKTISREDINRSVKLKAIGKQGTGIDIIDKAAAEEKGIPICNTPGVNALSVAELVLALTMAVARELRTISIKQVSGQEVRKEHCSGIMMSGKSIGILGMGAIGRAVACMFSKAFGASIWAYDPYVPDHAWSDIAHHRVHDFREMLPHVDMLTLHIPLTAETRGLIGADEIRLMRRTAILINVARGGIVDEAALLHALNEGILFGAGLDCHDEEPPTLQSCDLLWRTGRVVSTPHIGATTRETVVKTANAAIDNVVRALNSPKGQ